MSVTKAAPPSAAPPRKAPPILATFSIGIFIPKPSLSFRFIGYFNSCPFGKI